MIHVNPIWSVDRSTIAYVSFTYPYGNDISGEFYFFRNSSVFLIQYYFDAWVSCSFFGFCTRFFYVFAIHPSYSQRIHLATFSYNIWTTTQLLWPSAAVFSVTKCCRIDSVTMSPMSALERSASAIYIFWAQRTVKSLFPLKFTNRNTGMILVHCFFWYFVS